MMDKDIIILGGGLSGLSTAVQAINHGYRPIILEKNKHLGGRVRSFYSADIDCEIDNGQHVLSAAYEETIEFLTTVGSANKISYQKNFQVYFSKKDGTNFLFRTWPLPAPFHFFLPLIFRKKFTGLHFSESLKFIRKNARLSSEQLKGMTIMDWLDHCGQSKEIQKLLWQPLSYAILNTPVETGSAFLLKHTISRSFFHSRHNARLILPKSWLGEIFVTPALNFIQRNKGEVHLLTPAEKIVTGEENDLKIVTSKSDFNASWIISALPPFALNSILENSTDTIIQDSIIGLDHFDYNPIMTINIFLDQPINIPFPVAFIDSPLQWLFPHPKPRTVRNEFGYAIVISTANEWADKSREEIINMVSSELTNHLGIRFETSHRLLKYKIIKEKRATIAQTSVSIRKRPRTRTAIPNLFLAGDWTDTGLPATIEGAIVSGRLAIESIIRQSAKSA
jgi:squalene-associated FAD-dependent desaturase